MINSHIAFSIKNTVSYTLLDSLSFKAVSAFLNKYKKPIENKVGTLLQHNFLLIGTGLFEDDDPE